MSIVVSDIGAIDFVSLGGQSYRYGVVAANMDWIGTMPAILLAAFVFIPYYWRAGVYSVPEFLGRRYGLGVRALHSLAWTVFLVVDLGAIFWAAAGMFDTLLGAGFFATTARFLDSLPLAGGEGGFWSEHLAGEGNGLRLAIYVGITAVVTGVYTIRGGLRAVVYTDVIQLVIMFVGAALIVVLGLERVGGFDALRDTLVDRGHTEHFSLFLSHDTESPYPWTGVFFGLALVLAPAYFIGNQAIVQRTLGARDEWSAKAGTLFGGLLKFCIPFLVVLPGMIALALHPGLDDPDTAFGTLVGQLLPAGIRGVVFAGFLAALMSSVDSVLTSAATIITRDLYVGVLKATPDDRRLLRTGRWLTFALVIFGATTAPLSTKFEGIYAAIQSILAIIQGPTLALLLGGMFWRRATPAGGFLCLVVGLSVSTFLTVYQKSAAAPPFNAEEPFFAIAAISFSVSMLTLILVSLVTTPKTPEELRGLVYRASFRDDEAQDALRERAEGDE
jgi:SSS family solute:Na+ symporter